jgi:putative transposase
MVKKLRRRASNFCNCTLVAVVWPEFGRLTPPGAEVMLGSSLPSSQAVMKFALQPWHLLACIVAGYANREQQQIIDYLRTENTILREKLGRRRLRLNDDQRRLLAAKGKMLGRKLLATVATLCTPDTILRWHRLLIARKWDYSDRKTKPVGRPAIAKEVQELVVRVASENPSWGHDRIQGALANLGHELSDRTIARILKRQGIEPAPQRKRRTTWKTFLKAHWQVLAATDFTTVEVWTAKGLVTFYSLFVMELATRRVECAGITTNPDETWMTQMARNLTAADDGFLCGKRYLLMDRDSKFSAAFRRILSDAGTEPVRLPPRSPNLNAHIERFRRTLREECTDRMIFFGEAMLRRSVLDFIRHFHNERNHQGLDNRLIEPAKEVGQRAGDIHCRERLGGLLRYYYRQVA